MILSTEKDELIKKKQKLRHEAVPFFEDGPCYELEDLRAFHSAFSAFCYENDLEKCKTAMEKFEILMASMKKRKMRLKGFIFGRKEICRQREHIQKIRISDTITIRSLSHICLRCWLMKMKYQREQLLFVQEAIMEIVRCMKA